MKVSVQIYSLRDAGDLDTQLALAKAAGFDWIESVSAHGLGAAEFAARLRAHGLQLSSTHAALALLETDAGLQATLELCAATGCGLVVMPWLPMGERSPTAAGWRAIGQRLLVISGRLAQHGIRLGYHNHDFEFLSYEGRSALDWIFSVATPTQLGLELDLGWAIRAGQDPYALLDRHADRLVSLHAKDVAAPSRALDEDGWAALGDGIGPWVGLMAAVKDRLDLVVLEHDRPADHRVMLARSRAFLRQNLA